MYSIAHFSRHSLARLTALGLLAVAAPTSTMAATATSPLPMAATVVTECSINTAPLAFGAYDPIIANATAPLHASTLVSFVCTLGSNVTLTLGQGLHAAGSSSAAVPLRRMSAAGSFLPYFLYQDAGRTTVWGDTLPTGVASTTTGLNQTATVYGRIPAGQNVPAGSYTDTVVASVNF